MLKVVSDLVKSWWNIVGFILAVFGIVVGFVTQVPLYGVVSVVGIIVALIGKLVSQAKTIEQLKQTPPIDFAITETSPPRFANIHFFDVIGAHGKFEFVVNCDFINKLPHPITITCEMLIDTDLPIIQSAPQSLIFGNSTSNTMQLKGSAIQSPAMRMDVGFYLYPEEQRLMEIARATKFNVIVTYTQNDGKSIRITHSVTNPKQALIEGYESRMAYYIGHNAQNQIDPNKVIKRLKYLWGVLP